MFISYGQTSPGAYGMIRIDVNGPKPPNQIGKDFFVLHIIKTTDGNYFAKP